MRDDAMQLTLSVAGGAGGDERELDQLTSQLRQRLLEFDVASVKPVRGEEIPPGARPVDPITIGALVVSLTPAVLQSVVSFVETWAKHRRVKSVKMTIDGDSIELADAGPVEQEQLLQLFLDKHAKR